jgi:hypothetical protein
MTTFPGSPRLLKGAIVGLDPLNPLASIIVFQYNPETLTRRLDARATGGGGEAADRSEPFRLRTAPSETITLAVTVDATDQLEVADDLAVRAGVGPALSALEMLLYPKSTLVVANAVLAQLGNLEIIPPQAPLTVFVWGAQRVLPVRLTGFSITEQAYDAFLNPILAQVDLTLTVLSYADLKITDPGYTLFLAYQIAKELMASSNPAGSLLNTGASLPLL